MATNIKPEQFGTIFDPEMQQDIPVTYSYTPGSVGRMVYVGDPEMGEDVKYVWQPSQFDFSGAKYNVNKWGQHEYIMPDGSKVAYDINNDTVTSYIPSNLGKARADVVHSYNGNLLGNPFTYLQPENTTFQGQKVQRGEDVGDTFFLVNPNTYEYVKDAEGNYILPYDAGSGNWFTNFMADNGWMLPAAMGAGAALGAAGVIGGAAEAGAGAGAVGAGEAGAGYGSMDAYMAASGLNPGTYAAADFAPAYASMGDYMTQAGLEPGTFEGSAFQMPAGLSAKEAATWASRANNLAKLLNNAAGMGSTKGTGGTDLSKLASLLGGGNANQPNDYLGQIKMNEKAFFGGNQGTLSGENVYDVSGTNQMANALRKK